MAKAIKVWSELHQPARDFLEVPPFFVNQRTSPITCADVAAIAHPDGPAPWEFDWHPERSEAMDIVEKYSEWLAKWSALLDEPRGDHAGYNYLLLSDAIANWLSFAADEIPAKLEEGARQSA
ncbi:MAG: hypothetical protein AAGF75_00465 [Cyanobacteria bacterium P01_H01_bin.130]